MLVGSGRMLARLVRVVTAYARHAVPERWCVVGDVLAQASCVCVCVWVWPREAGVQWITHATAR